MSAEFDLLVYLVKYVLSETLGLCLIYQSRGCKRMFTSVEEYHF